MDGAVFGTAPMVCRRGGGGWWGGGVGGLGTGMGRCWVLRQWYVGGWRVAGGSGGRCRLHGAASGAPRRPGQAVAADRPPVIGRPITDPKTQSPRFSTPV